MSEGYTGYAGAFNQENTIEKQSSVDLHQGRSEIRTGERMDDLEYWVSVHCLDDKGVS